MKIFLRILSGGSWNNNENNVRSTNRNRNVPGNINNNVGLRLVCASTSQGRNRRKGFRRACKGSPERRPARRVIVSENQPKPCFPVAMSERLRGFSKKFLSRHCKTRDSMIDCSGCGHVVAFEFRQAVYGLQSDWQLIASRSDA